MTTPSNTDMHMVEIKALNTKLECKTDALSAALRERDRLAVEAQKLRVVLADLEQELNKEKLAREARVAAREKAKEELVMNVLGPAVGDENESKLVVTRLLGVVHSLVFTEEF